MKLTSVNEWITLLMEPKPEVVTFASLRKPRQGFYSSDPRHSNGGWWRCDIGTSYEDRTLLLETPVKWEPAHNVADPQDPEDTAAAMEVFKKCHERIAFGICTQAVPDGWAVCCVVNQKFNTVAPTIELAICLFAMHLFAETFLMTDQPPTCPKCGRRIIHWLAGETTREQFVHCEPCQFTYRLTDK